MQFNSNKLANGTEKIPRHGQHILKVLNNIWSIIEVALQNIGASLNYLINGAETNDYPYGKKWNWISTSHCIQQSIPDGLGAEV